LVVTVRECPLPPNARPWAPGHVPTAFQQAVIDAVEALAVGEVIAYGELAESSVGLVAPRRSRTC